MPMLKTRTQQNYPVIIEKSNDGFYLVHCPVIEDCYSEGKTIDETLQNIKDIIELRIEEGYVPKTLATDIGIYSVVV